MKTKFYELNSGEKINYPLYSIGNINDAIKSIENIAKLIKNLPDFKSNEYNSVQFLCRGSSGAFVAGLLANGLLGNYNVNICHVKKEGEKSHSSSEFLISLSDYTYIVDDLIDSGATFSALIDHFNDFTKSRNNDNKAKLQGLIIVDTIMSNTNSDFRDKLFDLPLVIVNNAKGFLKGINESFKDKFEILNP